MAHAAQQQLAIAQTGAPGLAVVEGTVARVRFANPENGFAIILLDVADGATETVKGILGKVKPGDALRIEGARKRDPKWGDQIDAVKVIPIMPASVDGVARYLSELPGLGDVLARRLVERFGDKAIDVLCTSPERVTGIPGLSKSKVEKARTAAKDRREEQEVLVWLYGIGLSPAFAGRVLGAWGAKAPTIIRANPYRLAREISMIGFALADSIARNMGIPEDAIERREAALLHLLEEASSSGARYKGADGKDKNTGGGHCYLPRAVLADAAALLLTLSRGAIEEAIGTLIDQGEIVIEEDRCYTKQLHRAEFELCDRIGVLLRNRRDPPPAPAAGSPASKALDPLSPEQRAAVDLTRASAVVVITGGPGTGKTTTMKAAVALWEQAKRSVLLCAPTGRAAKRLSETTGKTASTVHRLLEWQGTEGFQRNEKTPLVCDIVIVDEASMLDVQLARALVRAIPQGASLLLVGDVDQLPSVGAGQVLHDVIESQTVPVARLSRIFRQAAGSQISEAAAAILQGQPPRPGGELAIVPVWDPQSPEDESPGAVAQREIVRQVLEVLPALGFPPRQVQVLTPMHKGAGGTRELNRALQAALNPVGDELGRGPDRPPFRVGDPVLQTKNDYDLGIMNGDLGRIVAVDAAKPSITVAFDDEEVLIEKEALANVELAYAMSVHKSQGGEFQAVVLALLMEHWMMLRRNLFYTAITRGKKRVVIVGASKAMQIAARTRDTSTCYTGLRARLAALDVRPAPKPSSGPDPIIAEARARLAAIAPPPPGLPDRLPPLVVDRSPQAAAAKRAVSLLAGRCDGAAQLDKAGFSRFDAERGHQLAGLERPFTPVETSEATHLARKYQRQLPPDLLSALGIGGAA